MAYATRDESDGQRLDRNWDELLQELRVAQTGVQVLAGFLIILPFQQRFDVLSPGERRLYLVALALAIVASVLFLAFVVAHRVLFRWHEKDSLVSAAHQLARAGLVALTLTFVAGISLVFSVVVGTGAAVAAAAGLLAVCVVAWLVVPGLAVRDDR